MTLLRRRSGSRALRLAGAVYVPAALALAEGRERVPVPRGVVAAALAATPVALVAAMPRSRLRGATMWALHMWAYKTIFELPHDRPLAHRRRLRIEQPLRADARLCGGVPLPQRLQRMLRPSGEVGPLDYVFVAVYLAWLLELHAVLVWILVRRPERFAVSAARLGAAFDAMVVVYAAVPTAPPWWSSLLRGLMDGEVERVLPQVQNAVQGKEPGRGKEGSSANPWASTPSDHFGSAVAAALAAWELDRRVGAAAGGYALVLGCSLAYLGEHYGSDLVGGLAVAAGVRAAEPAVRPLARRVASLVDRLDAAAHGQPGRFSF